MAMKKRSMAWLLAAGMFFAVPMPVFAGGEELVTVEDEVDSIQQGDLVNVFMDSGSVGMMAVTGWEQTLKERLRTAMDNMELTVSVSDLEIDRTTDIAAVKNVLYMLINGDAKYFYMEKGFSWSYSSSTNKIAVLMLKYQPEYMDGESVDKDKIKKDLQYLEDGQNRALSMIKPEMSEPEIALALHDFLVSEVDYDYENYAAEDIPWYSYNALGVYREGKVVCNGYAIAYGTLLEKAGIPSYVVSSESMNHAWNMLYVDDNWYHADVTWDDPVFTNGSTYLSRPNNDNADEGFITHKYFLKSDAQMLTLSHKGWGIQHTEGIDTPTADVTGYPSACYQNVDGSMNYIDGYWYYAPIGFNGKTVYKAKFDGSSKASFNTSNTIRYMQGKDGVLYFCNPNGVYSVKPDGNGEKTEADYRAASVEVTELSMKKGEIGYVLADTSDSSKVKFERRVLENKVEQPFEITETRVVQYNQYKLSWNAKKGADGYVLCMGNTSAGPWSVAKSLSGTDKVNAIVGANANKDWYYMVKAYVLENGKKVYTGNTAAVKAPGLPGDTQLLGIVMRSSQTVEIKWQQAAHADGYVVLERAEDSEEFGVIKKVSAGDILSYSKKVIPGKNYFYKIKSFVETADGRRIYGTESAVLQGNVLSGPPMIISTEKYGSNKEKIIWTSVEGADGYVLLYSAQIGGTYTVKQSIANTQGTAAVSVYSDGTGYYKMCAYRLVDGIKRFTDYTKPFAAYNQK